VEKIRGKIKGKIKGTGVFNWSLKYEVNANFEWDYTVNVVNVTVSDPSLATSQAAPKQIGKAVVSGSPAMTAKATIVVTPPQVDGSERGAEFVIGGFIQNITINSFSAAYTTRAGHLAGTFTPNAFANHATLLDMVNFTLNNNGVATRLPTRSVVVPWYDSTLLGMASPPGTFTGSQATPDSPKLLNITDTPFFPLPRPRRTFLLPNAGAASGRLTGVTVEDDFDVFVAATTTDITALENKTKHPVFSAYAWGTWSFNGSGTIAGGTTWTAIAGTTGDSVTMNLSTNVAKAPLMVTSGEIANDVLNGPNSTW
jgi:hypothetical protein